MTFPEQQSPQDFAKWIVENKPYLVEIEEHIQAASTGNATGCLKLEVNIRGGNVMNIDFWLKDRWTRTS